MKTFPGGREAFSVATSALFKKAAIKSWDWPMNTWETEEGRGWQDNQTKGRRLLPGYNPGRLIQPSDPVQGLGSRRQTEDQKAPQARILRSRSR